ncbi:hypothetical protein [Noviherbaspirillum denitrificans]|uniref:Uncharacterized protein n=1 Tax=Noviherbaspirillum denitrificans TaxID=1968433 RepID=A0A254TIN7_9BURK|nr:hypothetical protein [Noviherbaspirillum denitrificans]OWW22355.1 hypothetical protein AYR66_25530 [Noviherbaspirillum denitrificans]
MTIRRDDLVAAAAAGLLQYRQVDPLLVFLLQRDITAQRQAMLAQQARPRQVQGVHALLSFILGVLAVITAAMFTVLFSSRAAHAFGSGAYVLFALAYIAAGMSIAAWFRRRGYGRRLRLLFAVVLATVPLAVVALQQVAT